MCLSRDDEQQLAEDREDELLKELKRYKDLYEIANKEIEAWREKPWAEQLREQSKQLSKLRAQLAEANKEIEELLIEKAGDSW